MQPHYVFLGKGHTAGGRKGKWWALEAGRVPSRTMQTVQIVHIPQLQYQVTQKTATVSFSTLAIAYMAVLSSTVISRPKASFSEGLEQPDIATAVYGVMQPRWYGGNHLWPPQEQRFAPPSCSPANSPQSARLRFTVRLPLGSMTRTSRHREKTSLPRHPGKTQ